MNDESGGVSVNKKQPSVLQTIGQDQVAICPVCGSGRSTESYRLKDRLSESSKRYPLYLCSDCELLYLDREITLEQISEFYPEGYWWQESGRFSSLEKLYRKIVLRFDQIRFLSQVFPDNDRLQLLDVGCGNGLFVKQAIEKGFEAYGLEASREAVEIARKDGIDTITCGSIEDLVKSGRQFDILTLFHCLEHLQDPGHYLDRIRNLLRPPGHLILQVPNRGSLQAKIFGSGWYGLDCPRHLSNFDEKSLDLLLRKNGFSIQKTRHFSFRDNSAALVSSLFPNLDPMAVKILNLKNTGQRNNWVGNLKELLYLGFFIFGQPFALAEALVKKGATLTIYARFSEPFEPSG